MYPCQIMEEWLALFANMFLVRPLTIIPFLASDLLLSFLLQTMLQSVLQQTSNQQRTCKCCSYITL